ncbi:hypothetical protein [Qipengyuania sediminis]|uniref:hypothetical protein n=1 Tax=Qipengyuania sediminis TaxID=1532023 RepID=UPI00105AA64F|nr:hypothetical protein [Qipengyuania sediminis]
MTPDPLPLGEVAARSADGEGAEPEPSAYDYTNPADLAAIVKHVRASADEEERYANRLDAETIGLVWPLALSPLGLVTLLLRGLLGDWAWILFPAGFLAMWVMLFMTPLRHRYASEQPLELPNALRLHGQRKRRFLLKLALIAGALFVGEALFRLYGGRLWDWTVPWPW